MLSPRVLKLSILGEDLIPFICSLIPNEETFSLKNWSYYFVWMDYDTMDFRGQIDLD